MKYNNTVVIMRGISGAGKDTWIKDNIHNARICSADLFFMKDGEYMFDVSRLPQAHSWCMSEFLKAVHDHVPTIVVNNTHIRCWEWENYARTALVTGYDVEIVSLICGTVDQVRNCYKRNVHGTPLGIVGAKALEFENVTVSCPQDLVGRIRSTVIQVR